MEITLKQVLEFIGHTDSQTHAIIINKITKHPQLLGCHKIERSVDGVEYGCMNGPSIELNLEYGETE